MNTVNVLLVEDDDLFRTGLSIIIEAEEDMNVSGMASNGREAIALIKQSKPDIVLLDLRMPDMDGIECIQEIRKLHEKLPILILTTFNEEEYIFQCLAYGANGYLLKTLDFAKLLQTIREAMNNQYVLPAEVAASIAKYVLNNDIYRKERELIRCFAQNDQFTKKEQDIMRMLLNRLSNKEIAAELFLTEGTVKNNLTALYEKLGAQNRKDAITKLESWINR